MNYFYIHVYICMIIYTETSRNMARPFSNHNVDRFDHLLSPLSRCLPRSSGWCANSTRRCGELVTG